MRGLIALCLLLLPSVVFAQGATQQPLTLGDRVVADYSKRLSDTTQALVFQKANDEDKLQQVDAQLRDTEARLKWFLENPDAAAWVPKGK